VTHGLARSLSLTAFLAPLATQSTPLGTGHGPAARSAYVSDERTNEVFELFSVPTDASAAPLVLSAALPIGGDVGSSIAQVPGGRVLYVAEQLVDNVSELFIVPDDGSAPPLKLSGPLVAGGNVSGLWAGETFVVYRADAVIDGRDELFRVPLDGSTPPVALTPGQDIYRVYALTRDGARVLYSTYPFVEERLHVVPADGSAAPLDLAGSGVPSGFAATWFWQVELTGDGQRVVFMTVEDDDSFLYSELWSARLDGSALVQLNPGPTFAPGEFQLAPDGARVVYEDADVMFGGYNELVSVRTDGSSFRVLTPGAARPGAFRVSDDSVFCVFVSREGGLTSLRLDRLDGTQPFELLAPSTAAISDLWLLRGSTTTVYLSQGTLYSLALPNLPVPISGPRVTNSRTVGFPYLSFTPDGQRVLYRSDEHATDVFDLYVAPVDGSSPPLQLNPPLAGGRDVWDWRLAPDGRLVYRADQVVNDQFALFGVPLDGSRPAVELNGPLATGEDVGSYAVPPRARRPLRAP